MLPIYDCGDHLHPSDRGYRAMGDAIDLSLFDWRGGVHDRRAHSTRLSPTCCCATRGWSWRAATCTTRSGTSPFACPIPTLRTGWTATGRP